MYAIVLYAFFFFLMVKPFHLALKLHTIPNLVIFLFPPVGVSDLSFKH